MNERGFSARRMLWKEARQLLPLMLILIGVGATLILLWSGFFLSNRSIGGYIQFVIPLLLPSLFAAGAAAVLVGQEKEQGTLMWLTSLPVPPSQLIRAKFVSALGGLAAMWVICWLMTLLVGLADPWPRGLSNQQTSPSIDLLFLHLHSLFVLLCGFYASWRIKNTFLSLLAIIPLATIPFAVTQIVFVIRERSTGYRFVEPGIATATSFTIMFVSMAVIGWLGYRAAVRQLGPAEPPRPDKRGPADWIEGWRVGNAAPARGAPFQLSISSLIWQAIHHNRIALTGIVAMILLGVIGLTLLPEWIRRNHDGIVLGSVLAVSLGTSFLGVFAFTGDGSSHKLRFLAERGIAPTRVWLGRQMIGVGILATLILIYGFISARATFGGRGLSMYLPSMSLITLAAAVVYSVSQWSSQLIRSLAASAFLAPAIAFTAVWWLGFCAIQLNTPLWLIVLVSLLPMAATWVVMPRFMDGSRQGLIYLAAGLTVLLVAMIPAIPVAIEMASLPGMTRAQRNMLSLEANNVARDLSAGSPMLIRLAEAPVPDANPLLKPTTQETLAMLEDRSFRPSDRVSLPSNRDAFWSIDAYALEQILATASYEKLRFRANPDGKAEIEDLGEWIETLTMIAQRLRASPRWEDQESADMTEIWLTQTLSGEAELGLRDREFYRDAAESLADSAARNDSRRRAVLASWRRSQLNERSRRDNEVRWGRSYLQELPTRQDSMSDTKRLLMQTRITGAIVLASLRMIEAGQAGQSTEPMRRELHDLIIGPHMRFEDGPYADRLRATARSNPAMSAFQMFAHPASQWFAPWEREAAELTKRPSQNDASQQTAGDTP
jgi:ABC-type transport system involved in multi-copper enzyme maturation permease subunit